MLKHRNSNLCVLPWWTLSIGAIALLIHLLPDAVIEVFQYQRSAICNGAIWQWFTGHLTHWNTEHLAVDLAVFTVLGTMVEKKSRKSFVLLFVASTICISASIFWIEINIKTYRGLSGVDMAIAGFVFLDFFQQAHRKAHFWETILWTGALIALILKPAIEMGLGHPIFVQDLGKGVIGLPLSHFIGAITGFVILLSLNCGNKSTSPTSKLQLMPKNTSVRKSAIPVTQLE